MFKHAVEVDYLSDLSICFWKQIFFMKLLLNKWAYGIDYEWQKSLVICCISWRKYWTYDSKRTKSILNKFCWLTPKLWIQSSANPFLFAHVSIRDSNNFYIIPHCPNSNFSQSSFPYPLKLPGCFLILFFIWNKMLIFNNKTKKKIILIEYW